MSHLRVAVIHGTMAPYRHLLFEELSKTLDLIVYYCAVKHSFRKWDLWPREYYYRYQILPKIPLGNLCVNPSIIKRLILGRPNRLVLSGYDCPTMWLGLAMAKLLKIPVIYWTEGTREPQPIMGFLTRWLRMLFIRKSDAIVVPGRLSKNYVGSLGADAKKVFVAPNAIDNELFVNASNKYRLHKEELKAWLGFKSKAVILYVGRLAKEKGVRFLLEAYGKLKSEINDIALVIVGYGELYNTLQKLCQEKKINDVLFTGATVNYRQLIKYYSVADVFVLPTLEDVWGFVINEAMACGLPVVSTRASQAAIEMVRSGENGHVVKEADSEELYMTLKELVYNVQLREKMARRSTEILVSEFDVKQTVSGFVKAVKYTIAKRQKP